MKLIKNPLNLPPGHNSPKCCSLLQLHAWVGSAAVHQRILLKARAAKRNFAYKVRVYKISTDFSFVFLLMEVRNQPERRVLGGDRCVSHTTTNALPSPLSPLPLSLSQFTEEELTTLGWSLFAASLLMFLIMAPNICFQAAEDDETK